MKVNKELLRRLDELTDSDARCLLVEALEQGIEVEELLIRLDSEYAELLLESVWINKLRKKNKRKREKLRFVVIENQKQDNFFEELFAQDLEGKEAA
jgi:ribonuclease HI